VEDVYLSVRLEAGTLHLAKYLILATFYFLATKLAIIIQITKPRWVPPSDTESASEIIGFWCTSVFLPVPNKVLIIFLNILIISQRAGLSQIPPWYCLSVLLDKNFKTREWLKHTFG